MPSPRSAIIVPHAPALLLDAHAQRLKMQRLYTAARAAAPAPSALVCVLSPHGERSGVYRAARGTLDDFGIRGMNFEWPTDAGVPERIARAWKRPLLDDSLDHGACVALSLVGVTRSVVAATVSESDSPEQRAAAGAALGRALAALDEDVTLIATLHGSAALTPRAPLTERPGAREAEEEFVTCLAGDLGAAVDAAVRLEVSFGSCAAPGAAAVAELVGGQTFVVDAREEPFGVGYLVAHTR